jgi:branched-chain amino acid transport system ATP-binding protein
MTSPTPLLELGGIVKRFGNVTVLDGLALEMGHEIRGLIGPNGAGKTTLFNVIGGAVRPDAGTISLEGIDLRRLRPDERCRLGLARTFQVPRLFAHLSVLENVTVGAYFGAGRGALRAARDSAREALALIGEERLAGMPASVLSIGQRKMTELTRALATRPRLVLLDEVMAGLNGAEIDVVSEALLRVHDSGVAMLMVEHVMRAVMSLSHTLSVLSGGSIIVTGKPADVATDPRVIEVYLGSTTRAA